MEEPWMMFTHNQGKELIDNTASEWTTINGVNGRKFVNKTDDSKYIFLPSGGLWRTDKTHNNTTPEDVSIYSYYCSTTILSSNISWAWYLNFGSSLIRMVDGLRYWGYSIRPVAPKRPW